MQMPTPKPQFSVALDDNPILIGFRHAENEPENYSIFAGEDAQFQRENCNDFSLMREVPREEWPTCGYFIEEHDITVDGLTMKKKVVLEKANRTAKVIEDRKNRARTLAAAENKTVDDVNERLAALEAQNRRLMALLEQSNSFAIEKAEQAALDQGRAEMEILAGADDKKGKKAA